MRKVSDELGFDAVYAFFSCNIVKHHKYALEGPLLSDGCDRYLADRIIGKIFLESIALSICERILYC